MGQGAIMSAEERQSSKAPGLDHSAHRPLQNSIVDDSHQREEGQHLCIQQPFQMLVLQCLVNNNADIDLKLVGMVFLPKLHHC